MIKVKVKDENEDWLQEAIKNKKKDRKDKDQKKKGPKKASLSERVASRYTEKEESSK